MLKLFGIQRKTGVYEGNSYDNIMLHCLDDAPYSTQNAQLIGGQVCETVKVRAADVRNVFGGLISTDDDFVSIIGQGLQISYDRYGRPVQISFVDIPDRKGV